MKARRARLTGDIADKGLSADATEIDSMIIWGSTGREVELARGLFHCPTCNSEQVYMHIRLARYFTLYFIPLFQTQNLGEWVKCKQCALTYAMEILDFKQQVHEVIPLRPQDRPTSVNIGDRILAQWPYDQFFYPGVVLAGENGRYQIAYDDGNSAWVLEEQIATLDISVGTRVFARWKGGQGYYPGIISERNGDAIHIRYDDGDQEWTTLYVVRVERKNTEVARETHVKGDRR